MLQWPATRKTDKPHSSVSKLLLTFALLLSTLWLGGCASSGQAIDERDPWESYNRSMYKFNEKFDQYIFKPVSRGYRAVTPQPVDNAISRFFSNLGDIPNSLNNLLQGKPLDALSDLGRFTINSTIGIFGFFDPATHIGLKKHNEDFGQTLAKWGVPTGPYVILPILGPSTVTDTAGLATDWQLRPQTYIDDRETRYATITLEAVDTRADLLGASKVLDAASFDQYAFLREAYFQRRRNLKYDGNPPAEAMPFDDFMDMEELPIDDGSGGEPVQP